MARGTTRGWWYPWLARLSATTVALTRYRIFDRGRFVQPRLLTYHWSLVRTSCTGRNHPRYLRRSRIACGAGARVRDGGLLVVVPRAVLVGRTDSGVFRPGTVSIRLTVDGSRCNARSRDSPRELATQRPYRELECRRCWNSRITLAAGLWLSACFRGTVTLPGPPVDHSDLHPTPHSRRR